ncbi:MULTISPECIES: adenosine deaminase [Ralstonia solanacearum species complex]|uniref:Adenine deaminase n=1 Tax=Ralstonia solanacearum (strain UW551) TaxID=342110 RepID=A0AB33VBY9_RALSU|nr:adenosine deaminase [Ralstonia solanacearum]ALF87698.1 Adenine deaminase [Ralstonia solanacearum]ATI27198.1 adenosine deaminase [Ralstonia solanacearum]EAP71606.1 Adenosine deaminase [Ralstonia solanacearum UW551]KEI30810.1 adenine deaminase [Ralstonia solanacearum]KFX77253.1 adenine deaminase [Ralstonia solanacearum]
MPISPALAERIATSPKAELHIHIEGSLEPELMFALAERNGVKLPYASVEAVRAAYAFDDLQSFLELYYAGASVLLTEQDFYDMTAAYVARAVADNVRHAEIFFDPQTHTARDVPMHVVIGGIVRALDDAERAHGFSSRLILCFLRHLSEEDAFDTLEAALPYIQDPANRIIGVGLDSSERGNPPEKFARVFARCKELGLRLVAHAGEEGPAQYVIDALDILRVERIDHGVRAIDDAALVKRLAASRVALTVCPLSNEKLKVYPDLRDHSLKQLLDAGCAVTLHSDDPAYFGGYMNTNWLATFNALDLSAADAHALARNSFEASFLPEQDKALWLARVDDHWKATH